jgi:SAM-dependent methyltransferase
MEPKMDNLNKEESVKDQAKTYDRDAEAFAQQSKQLMTWKYIGSRALDKSLAEFYGKKDIKVLDQGSASGRVVEYLIEKGIPAENIDGIELSPEQVKIAVEKNLGANFRVGDLRKDVLPENTYDLVTRHMVDEHLDNEGLLEVSKNTLRTLKPGGTAVVVFTHPDKITASAGIDKEGWFETTFPWKDKDGQPTKGQNYFRPVETYVNILKEAGFEIDAVEDWQIPPEAESQNKEEYEKYKSYGNVRLSVKAHKPE